MGIPNRIFNHQQAMQAMQAVDKNYDGRADRMEVYLAVRQTYGSFWQQNPNYQPVYPQQQAFHYQQNPGYQQMQPYQPKTVIIKSNQGTHVIMGNQPQYNPYQGYWFHSIKTIIRKFIFLIV